jgi:hypothetical protein
MTIETKFKIGDSAWYFRSANVIEIIIQKITIYVEDKNIKIIYQGEPSRGSIDVASESELYKTKEECALAWIKKQNLKIDSNGTIIENK